jgi:hypothetical protein
MQVQDRAAHPATDETLGPALGPLVGALQSLYRAYQKTSIYPRGHPSVPEALKGAIQDLNSVFEKRECVAVGVARDHLLIDGQTLTESSGTLNAFARLLHDLDVVAVKFHPGLDAEELEAFILALGKARADGVKGGALVESLVQGRVTHLDVTPIDYAAFTFADGARVEPAERDAQDLWENLSNMLAESDTATDEADPAQLATEISQDIELHEGTGIGRLRESVREASEHIESCRPDWRALARERLAKFVSALNPRLRHDLLRVDPRTPGESMQLLSQLADVVPDAELIEVLQKIDRSGARVPSQLMTLMNKMVRISRTRPALASGLESTLAKWGISKAAFSVPSTNIGGALEEVFQRRDRLECNPEPYQDLLDDLSRVQLRVELSSYEERYRDPRDAKDVRVHAAEVATRVLNVPGGQQFRPALFGYVGAETDALIDRGKLGTLQDATVAATTYSQMESESNDTYRAARGFLHEFKDPERIARVLERVRAEGELSEAATSLIRLGGTESLGRVLDCACAEITPELSESLLRFAASFTPDELRQALEERVELGWSSLKQLFPTIRTLPDAMALQVLEKLLSHDEERVRVEALLAVCDLERRQRAAERHLRRALEDSSLQVVATAIRRLGEIDSERATQILAGYVRGNLGRVKSRPAFARRAVKHVIRRGKEGRARLLRCLGELSWSVTPRKIELASIVARALEPYRDDRVVQRALRHWRLCPAGLLRAFASSPQHHEHREDPS